MKLIITKSDGTAVREISDVSSYSYNGLTIIVNKNDGKEEVLLGYQNVYLELVEEKVDITVSLTKEHLNTLVEFMGKSYCGCFDRYIAQDCPEVDKYVLEEALYNIFVPLSKKLEGIEEE